MAQTYAPLIKDVVEKIQSLLQDSSRTNLAGVDDDFIMIGNESQDFVYPQINIKPLGDDIKDETVSGQVSDLTIEIKITVKEYTESDALMDLVDLMGDIYDELMIEANRTLADKCRISTVNNTDFGDNAESGFLRRGVCRVDVAIGHKVS